MAQLNEKKTGLNEVEIVDSDRVLYTINSYKMRKNSYYVVCSGSM